MIYIPTSKSLDSNLKKNDTIQFKVENKTDQGNPTNITEEKSNIKYLILEIHEPLLYSESIVHTKNKIFSILIHNYTNTEKENTENENIFIKKKNPIIPKKSVKKNKDIVNENESTYLNLVEEIDFIKELNGFY